METHNETRSNRLVNVGSRVSELALIQTKLALDQLERYYENNPSDYPGKGELHDQHETEGHKNGQSSPSESKLFNVISMTTKGDRILDKPLPEIGAKSLFTKDLEDALLKRRIDFIVHSLKDLPTTLPKGCAIGAIMKRDDPDDTIVLKKSLLSKMDPIEMLLGLGRRTDDKRLKIGTSSPRRIALIRRCNPDFECVDIRGNLNTRLLKLDKDDSEYSAIVLAKAGLKRMGWLERSSNSLCPNEHPGLEDWCYAVGQGAIAIECRSDDKKTLELLAPLVDLKTTYEALAERSLMRELEGGCSVPLGVRSTWVTNNILELKSVLLSKDGARICKASDNVTVLDDSGTELVYDSEFRSNCSDTGIILPDSLMGRTNVRRNMIECSQLGIRVANKMIESGCRDLI